MTDPTATIVCSLLLVVLIIWMAHIFTSQCRTCGTEYDTWGGKKWWCPNIRCPKYKEIV